VGSALGAELGVVAQGEERVLVRDGHEGDIAALAAHPSVRAALRHVGLPAEADASAAAVAALHEDLDPVDEHGSPRNVSGLSTGTHS